MQQFYTQSIVALIVSILGSAYLIPKIRAIVLFKHLMDNPNERSSHKQATPSLGGIAFYILLILSMYFNHSYDTFKVSMSIIPGLTILLFLGLKDDLVVLAPRTKLIGQICASLFILMNIKFEINSLHGFFGIEGIPYWAGLTISLLLMLAVINAFNLIDGIDGLAGSIGIVAFSGFAIVFFYAERYFFSLTCIVMVGILMGFLYYNLSSRKKIFMGDTGSMIVGFMLAVMSIRFLSLDTDSLNRLPFNAVDIPIVIISFLIIPLFDTSRVVIIRLLNGKEPFSPDRNHLHHVLVDAHNISHRRASFFIAVANIACVMVVSLVIKTTNAYISTGVIFVLVIAAAVYLSNLKAAIEAKPYKQTSGNRPKRKLKLHAVKSVEQVGTNVRKQYGS